MKKRILIVSPHPDDAVFSLGAHILHYNQYQILVWNLFSIQNYSIHKSAENPKDEIIKEDKEAAEQLGFQVQYENYKEAGMRGCHKLSKIFNYTTIREEDKEIFSSLVQRMALFLESKSFDKIYIPLGCGGHVDHILARDSFLTWWLEQNKHDFKLYAYEDLPYGTNSEWLQKSLEISNKYSLHPHFMEINCYINDKLTAIAIYKSQIRKRDLEIIKTHSFDTQYGCMVERTWEIKPKYEKVTF
ncbi:MAG: hypothetical protein LBV11_03970 [Bacillus cereus]|jgi:LmbE family N-acetylglucosaminyl deacetylase|nr:hypothetical protein [Bacillus cereus]